MTRVLVTRPREEAEALAARLQKLGYATVVEPMIAVRAVADAAVNAAGIQAVVFTSANGVRALSAARGSADVSRDCPVFAVGAATAAAARAAGFRDVREGSGTVEELARLIALQCVASHGPILHVSGSVVARDLGALLDASGLAIRRAVLYETVAADRIGEETIRLFAGGEIDAALFFSPRTAATFVKLIGESRSASALARVTAVALSPAVAEVLKPVPFIRVATAARPNTEALLDALASVARP